MKRQIQLDFGGFVLTADLFETRVAKAFVSHLPYQVRLTQWGNELYGSIGKDLGEEDPIPDIPEGGIAYTRQGNYVCIFLGQRPAWPVEYIGQIPDSQLATLLGNPGQTFVEIR